MRIPVFDIFIGERRRKEMGDIEDMQKDLRENGQITAITVRPPSEIERDLGVEEPYVLVAGGRRLAAALMLGWPDIEAYVRTDTIDEIKHRILELHENLKRKEMTWDEVAKAKKEIFDLRHTIAEAEGKTITQREVAIELKEDPATFSRDIKVAEAMEANPELRKAPSRKAALRTADMIQHTEQRAARVTVGSAEHMQLSFLKRVIVTADGRDFLRNVSPRSQDLVLTDGPYWIDYYKQGQKMTSANPGQLGIAEYDDREAADPNLYFDIVPLWVKVLRETGWLVCFCGRETYAHIEGLIKDCCGEHADYRSSSNPNRCAVAHVENSPNPCRFLRPETKPWIWYRPNSRNRSRYPDLHAQNVYEDILVVNMGKARLTKHCSNMLIHDAEYGDTRIHPMQKPLSLLGEIIERTTYYGDSVIDTFFGSGATLAAAARAGRYIMGCEKNPDLLPAALGYITSNFEAIALEGRRQSDARYQKNSQERKIITEEEVDAEA